MKKKLQLVDLTRAERDLDALALQDAKKDGALFAAMDIDAFLDGMESCFTACPRDEMLKLA